MFDDSTQPFSPEDPETRILKPKVGDILILRDMPEINEGVAKVVKAVQVHDSLAEDWDPVGECAWAQHEVNDTVGWRGRWYAIVQDPAYEGEEWSVASYEVAQVIPK